MAETLDNMELADQLGFDWVTVAEHHYAPMSLSPNPMVVAGALTQRVKKAKIALLGATIPILNPIRVAEEFAMLDTLTGGRVVAGMLRGTSNEYATYHVNPAESRQRFEEALELIVRAWTEPQPFGWEGRYFEYRTVSVWPRPVQAPHPPIYMSGSSPESGEYAARNRIKLGFAFTTVPLAADAARYYRQCCALAGWEPAPDDVLYRTAVYVDKTDEEALAAVRPMFAAPVSAYSTSNKTLDEAAARAGFYGRDEQTQRGRLASLSLEQRLEQGQLLCGSPATVLQQIQAIRDQVGAGILDLIFLGSSRERTQSCLQLFATEVLPPMHEL